MDITYTKDRTYIKFNYGVDWILENDRTYGMILRTSANLPFGHIDGNVEQYKDTDETTFINEMVKTFNLNHTLPLKDRYKDIKTAYNDLYDDYKTLKRLFLQFNSKYKCKYANESKEREITDVKCIDYNYKGDIISIRFCVDNVEYSISMSDNDEIIFSTYLLSGPPISEKTMDQRSFYVALRAIDDFSEKVKKHLDQCYYHDTFTVKDLIEALRQDIPYYYYIETQTTPPINELGYNMNIILNSHYFSDMFLYPGEIMEKAVLDLELNINLANKTLTNINKSLKQLEGPIKNL